MSEQEKQILYGEIVERESIEDRRRRMASRILRSKLIGQGGGLCKRLGIGQSLDIINQRKGAYYIVKGFLEKTADGLYRLDAESAKRAEALFQAGADTKEIAEILGVSEAAVWNSRPGVQGSKQKEQSNDQA